MTALTFSADRLLNRIAPVAALLDACGLVALASFAPPRNLTYVLAGLFLGVLLFLVDLFALRYRASLVTVASIVVLMVEFLMTNAFLPTEVMWEGADFLLHLAVAVTVQYSLLFALRHRIATWLQHAAAA